MTVRELGAEDRPGWERLLADCPGALVYQHPAWLDAVCEAEGYQPLVLGHESSDGRLDGVLPLVSRRGLATGRRLISLPHTPVAGPLGCNPEGVRSLVEAARAQARDAGARLELKTRTRELGPASPGLSAAPWSITFVLDLPEHPDELRFGNSRNQGRIRWAVAKAGRAGVTVRDGSEADLRGWHRLYLLTMRRHAVPPRSLPFFTALWRRLGPLGLARLVLAEREGRLLAGSMLFQFGSTVFYAFNGRLPEALSLRPNDLIQWRAIHDAVRAGFRRYDFGEVEPDQGGLAAFKSKWGAEPERLYRYLDPPARSSGALGLDQMRRAGSRLWRRLPLAATARIGDLLYRRL